MTFNVYVANLSKDVEGYLVGEWLELPMDEEDLEEKLKDILGEDEEYAIHDYENDLGLKIDEYTNLHELNTLAGELEDLEDYEREAVGAYLEHIENNIRSALEVIQSGDFVVYEAHNETELGYELVDMGYMGEVPENLVNYLNYESIGRDFTINTSGGFYKGSFYEFVW